VGPQTLDLLIGVRIPASQLDLPKSGCFVATFSPLPASSSNSAVLRLEELCLRVAFHEPQIKHCGLNVLMTQPFLHSPKVHSVPYPLRCTVMPEIVETRPGYLGSSFPRFKFLPRSCRWRILQAS